MAIGDKVVGKTKQLIAEVVGDGKLNEEGKEQARDRNDSESVGKRGTTGQSVHQKNQSLRSGLMERAKTPKTREELRRMALPQVRGWPGCADVRDVSIYLDEDGDWSITAHVAGAHDAAAVNRATTAVRNELRKQFSLQTDT